MNIKPYIDFFSAALTPLIAIIATYIAYEQYRINRDKLRHDLYEKRLSIFKAVSGFLILGRQEKGLNLKDWYEFHLATSESPFLFDEGVCTYIKELADKGSEKALLHHMIKDPKFGDAQKMTSQMRDIERWFKTQEELLVGKFMKYLNLKTIK